LGSCAGAGGGDERKKKGNGKNSLGNNAAKGRGGSEGVLLSRRPKKVFPRSAE